MEAKPVAPHPAPPPLPACRRSPEGPMIARRTFLTGTGALLLAAPLAAPAQQAGKVYRIGYVGVAPIPLDDAFRAGLRDLGYLERQNLIIEYRWERRDWYDICQPGEGAAGSQC